MNKKNGLIWLFILLIIIVILVLVLLIFNNKNSINFYINNEINKNIYHIDNGDNNIYSLEYQNLINKNIKSMIKKNNYTFNDPLLILNPYGTNLLGLYIYFETGNDRALEYMISVDDESIPDYTNMLVGDFTKIHNGQIIGLVQGIKNIITFRLLNENMEQVAIRKIVVNMPLYNEESMLKIEVKEQQKLSGGLIYVPYEKDISSLSFYDDNGILRMELYGDNSLKYLKYNDNGELLYFSGDRYIHINKYGKIMNYYDNIDELSDFINNDKIRMSCLVKDNVSECINYGFNNILFGTLKGYFNNNSFGVIDNNKIIVSKDKKYRYNPGNNVLFGLNGLSVIDFIYYDNIYFDIYKYTNDEIIIPSKIDVVDIKKIAGFHLSDVKTIKIESGIEEIMDYCFVGNRKLEKIYIPKSVVKIGKNIFGDREVEIIYY